MAYFPLFVDLEGKTVLAVGGGTIACRRILALLPFGCKVHVVSPALCEELDRLVREGMIGWSEKNYGAGDLTENGRPVFVLAATDDREVNRRVAEDCRALKIPVNNASRKESSDFYFPGLIKEGDMVVGVTASGTGHKKAAELTAALRLFIRETWKV